MIKLSKYVRNVCRFFVVRHLMFYKKTIGRLNQKRILNNATVFSHPHCVCHPHSMIFSSALVCAVAQVEKHCPMEFN